MGNTCVIHGWFMSMFGKKKRICLSVQEMRVRSLGREDPLEKEMATYSSILAWRIRWTKEPGGRQLMGLPRIGYSVTNTHSPYKVSLLVCLVHCILQFLKECSTQTTPWNRRLSPCQLLRHPASSPLFCTKQIPGHSGHLNGSTDGSWKALTVQIIFMRSKCLKIKKKKIN